MSSHPGYHGSADLVASKADSADSECIQESALQDTFLGHPASAPTSFHPLFTLIEDTDTGGHQHPYVHYVFADDDPDTLTSLLVDGMQPDQQHDDHRLLLIDVGHDGRTIETAHSLSGDWQIEHADLVSAPSWTGATPQTADARLMLKITGCGSSAQQERPQSQASDPVHQMEADIEEYFHRLQHLQTILGKDTTI